jgi:hypothetical protein
MVRARARSLKIPAWEILAWEILAWEILAWKIQPQPQPHRPSRARRRLEFVWLERVDDAVAAAFEPADAEIRTRTVVQG